MHAHPLRAVVLDLDGTLMDHAGAARGAAIEWLRDLGADATMTDDALAAVWFAAEDRHFIRFERGEIDHQEQRRERLRELRDRLGLRAPEPELDPLFEGFLAAYRQRWTAYPDAPGCVAALREQGLRLAVLTNGVAEQQRAKVRAIGLEDLLTDGVFATDELPAAKPSPRAYAAVAAALDLAPQELVMVGDNPHNDVAAPRAAGWHAVWVDRDDAARRQHTPVPDGATRISSLTGLPAVLRP